MEIKDYDKLLRLYRTKGIDSVEYQKYVKKTGKTTSMIEKEPIFSMVEIYNQLEKYQILGEAYMVQEDLDDEVEVLVSSGKKMLESYENAIEEFLKDYKQKKSVQKNKVCEDVQLVQKQMFCFFECIKEEKWDEVNKWPGWIMQAITIMLDSLSKMEEEDKWGKTDYRKDFYELLISLLRSFESKQYNELQSIIEEKILPLLDELILYMKDSNAMQMEE